MFGIRDNRQWVGFKGGLTSNIRQAMKYETFEEARQHCPEHFCAVRIEDERTNASRNNRTTKGIHKNSETEEVE